MFSARPGQRPRWSWLDTEPRGYLMVLKLAGWNHQGTVGGSALVLPRAPEASISPLELLGAGGGHTLFLSLGSQIVSWDHQPRASLAHLCPRLTLGQEQDERGSEQRFKTQCNHVPPTWLGASSQPLSSVSSLVPWGY